MTIDQMQDTIIEEFAGVEDWLEKYDRLIELGRNHPPLDDEFKSDDYALPGCQSQVWIRHELADGVLHLQADSDSLIIKGILALLVRTLDNQSPAEIAQARLYFLDEIGLSSNLSPSRANGVATIVRHLQQCGADKSVEVGS